MIFIFVKHFWLFHWSRSDRLLKKQKLRIADWFVFLSEYRSICSPLIYTHTHTLTLIRFEIFESEQIHSQQQSSSCSCSLSFRFDFINSEMSSWPVLTLFSKMFHIQVTLTLFPFSSFSCILLCFLYFFQLVWFFLFVMQCPDECFLDSISINTKRVGDFQRKLHYICFFILFSNSQFIDWSIAEEARVETSRLVCIWIEYRSICFPTDSKLYKISNKSLLHYNGTCI